MAPDDFFDGRLDDTVDGRPLLDLGDGVDAGLRVVDTRGEHLDFLRSHERLRARRSAKNDSTARAISCSGELQLALARTAAPATVAGLRGADELQTSSGASTATNGLVSRASLLMLIKCNGVMLSLVDDPPHVPGPSVIAGASPVVPPTAPRALTVFTVILNAGFSSKNRWITFSSLL